MRQRIPLKPNTDLKFTNHAGGEMHYVAGEVIGMGGSCIVYDGYFINNAGTKYTVRIKECYPYKLHIDRDKNGNLIAAENEKEKFEEYKSWLRKSFDLANEFHQTKGLTNLTLNVFDRYEANQTVYMVSSYTEGSTLAEAEIPSLKDAVRIGISVSKSIGKIHDSGFLFLDIKPENILAYKETPDITELFDFDSIVPISLEKAITEYRISYTKGYAPVEQKAGRKSQIGRHTDIYSIGALLFFMLFGRPPKLTDCGFDAAYDYDKLKWTDKYQPKVYRELTVFFQHTLQPYYKDRYQTMEEVVSQLQLIEKYADLPVPFILSGFVANSGAVVGREQECSEIKKWCEQSCSRVRSVTIGQDVKESRTLLTGQDGIGDHNLLFLIGMGGIGKSTLVRKFISENKEKFDHLIYLQFRNNIVETITDDVQFCINGYEKHEEETNREYFYRKIKAAKELTADTDSVLILDNFSGNLEDDFLVLRTVNWKIIVVTRSDMTDKGYDCLKIEPFHKKEEQILLFENTMGRRLSTEEKRKAERITSLVAGHTLALVLIAGQIAKSFLSIDSALKLVEMNGFSDMAPEKVSYMQDGKSYYDRISAILKAVYDVSGLTKEKKKCLKILSLFDEGGIEVKEAGKLLQLESLDSIHELVQLGWLTLPSDKVIMHPLIRETMQQIPWTEEYREIAIKEMQLLFKEIKLNGKQEEYPKKLYESNKKIRRSMQQSDVTDKLIRRILKKKGILGEITLERIQGDEPSSLPDYQKLRKVLTTSQSVLLQSGKDSGLAEEKMYKNLLFATLINSPKDQEDYIIDNCGKLFGEKDSANPYTIMELYDYVVYLFCQKADYAKAGEYLDRAKSFANKWKDHYIRGLYYDMLADFYEALLDGRYYSKEKDEKALMEKMLMTMDKAIHHMDRSKHEMAKNRNAKNILGKAALMIRNTPEKSREIKAMITEAKKIVEKYTLDYARVRFAYYMVLAWYHTLCEPQETAVFMNLKEAAVIMDARNMSNLDAVDDFYIPAANMMCELGNTEVTLDFLDRAYDLCEKHTDAIPYIRKKLDLLQYQIEVCREEEDREGERKYQRRMEEVSVEAKSYGICN